MGTEAIIGGLFGLASAGVSAASSAHTQSANASAQASINEKTMKFNREEAEKARKWQAEQAGVTRQYNTREALAARQFTAKQAELMMDFNRQEAEAARTFNAQESYLARQFEERMSSTAHQREVQDLYSAGLNPILSATGGNGASSPVAPILPSPAASGSMGSSAQASANAPSGIAASIGALNAYAKRNVLGDFVNSALDSMRVSADLKRAEAEDKRANAEAKNAETRRYAEDWRYWLENKKVNISQAEANARIDKLNNEIKIAYEDLDIRKDLRDASVEERKAMVAKLMSDVDVSKSQAALLNLQQEELSRKMRYGAVLMTYLPADIRDKVASHMIDFIAENGDLLDDFLNKQKGDIFEKASDTDIPRWVTGITNWLHKKGW